MSAQHRKLAPTTSPKVRAKILELFENHDITQSALSERYGISVPSVAKVISEEKAKRRIRDPL